MHRFHLSRRRALLLTALCLLGAGAPGGEAAAQGRPLTTRGPTSAQIIARRQAEAEAREEKRRAWLARGNAGAPGSAEERAGAVREDLAALAAGMGWQTRLARDRIEALAALIVAESERYALPPALVLAIIHLESDYDPLARSSAGATGLMQVMPGWPAELDYRFGRELTDEATNVRYGTWILQDALLATGGDVRRALLRYNGCPPAPLARCASYPDRVRELVEADARRTCGGLAWDACVAEPLRRSFAERG